MDKRNNNITHEQRISYLGSFPPIIQFIGVILGVFLSILIPSKMLPSGLAHVLGILFILVATLLIFWALKTSARFRHRERKGEARNFHSGPYRWLRNPTSFSLAVLVIGLGFLMNSLMIVCLSAVGYWLSYIVYEEEKERIMEEKYKEEYINYKNKVR
ncbi:MAG: Phospholipid methyltransferase [Candidatus Parcubacteria bacterium]|jgi:protein-S-isoprenylcysteine O-methyltransferase Ste14